ncbi:MAG TPA: sigma factor regulator FecR, partial [Deltaproteobacteria bacterium]|nr:sigma factor regulator FecR [Deltaproteobacteria bacterium]
TVSCLSCKKPYDRDEVQERIRSGIKAPSCDDCGGILKPDTVSFGQAMPEEEMNKAMMYAQQSDLCIVLGSSLVVYPAASVPVQAVRGGASLMIINRDPTPHDAQADLVIHDSVSDALEQMLKPF